MLYLDLEPRARPLAYMQWAAPLMAFALTLLVTTPFLMALGLDPAATLRVFLLQPLSSAYGVSEWLMKASPLILIAVGLTLGFRASVWNIGAEGMFTTGAIAAAALGLHVGSAGRGWLLPAMLLAGAAGGALWASIPAFLRTRCNTSEILVSLMLNYVAALLLVYLVNGPLQDPDGMNYPQSAPLDPAALFAPLFNGQRLNASVGITLACVFGAWFFVRRAFLGFQMRVSGAAPAAARYAGFSQARIVWVSLLVSGATAGLAGAMEVAGPLGQLSPSISPGYGFAAIIVAFVGRLSPLGCVFGGLLMSLLYLGGEAVQVSMNVPASLARCFQGLLLFFLLAADVLIAYRVRVRRAGAVHA
jgi:general nucleoside transport system permease protein